MNRLKTWIKNFFGFSKTEANAFLILLPLMILILFTEPAYQYWFVRQPRDFSKEEKALDSLVATFKWEQKDTVETKPHQSFSFNPNTVSKNQLVELGFTPYIATRIINYRSKGAKYIVKNDLLKIYGIDTAHFKKIIHLIDLPDKIVKEKTTAAVSKPLTKPKPSVGKFDLNWADTTQLIAIYGVGAKLSKRIIAYRNKLGGFISNQQLHEVYGLDSTVIKEIQKKSFIDIAFKPKQLDLNKASEKELGQHPYIKFKLAKAISAYVFQHGKFQSVDELKKITLIDETTFKKIRPYATVSAED